MRRVIVVTACALALAGCGSLRDLAGLQKKSPDEFAVTTKAPLVIPPDFSLRPPMPGAPPSNSVAPTATAEQALFNTSDPQTVANGMRGNYSMAEKLLMANAGVQNSDPAIRARIAGDARAVQNSDKSFTDRVLGASPTPDTGQPLNADAVVANKRAGNTAKPAKKKDSGWFDWL
jgi:hypothetical protein